MTVVFVGFMFVGSLYAFDRWRDRRDQRLDEARRVEYRAYRDTQDEDLHYGDPT